MMENPKFTPGPWKMTGENDRRYVRGGGTYIMNRNLSCQSKAFIERVTADCLLVAAAPELYAVLNLCKDYISHIPESSAGGDDYAIWLTSICEKALKKANGEI